MQKTAGGDATLTAIAGEQINLQFVNFTSTTGKLNLSAFAPHISLSGVNVSTNGGSVFLQGDTDISLFKTTLTTSGGDITLRGDTNIDGDNTGVSDINTGGGDLIVEVTGPGDILFGLAKVDAGSGSINLTSTGAVIFFGPFPPEAPIVVNSSTLNITAADLIGFDFFQMNTGDVNLTADIISGGGRGTGIPDIISSGNVTLNGAGVGLYIQGQSTEKLTANYTGGAAANTFDFFAFTGGCSGGECYSIIKETGFGTVELVKTAGFSATATEIRVEGEGSDFIGAVVNSAGFHFKDIPGFNILASEGEPDNKGISVANAGLFRVRAGNSGIFFNTGASNVGSQLSFKEVTSINGNPPQPFFSVLPYSGSGQVFLNGERVIGAAIGQSVTNPESRFEWLELALSVIGQASFDVVGMIKKFQTDAKEQFRLERRLARTTRVPTVTLREPGHVIPSEKIALPLSGTPNQIGDGTSYEQPTRSADGKIVTTWGWDKNKPEGQGLQPDAGSTAFEPIDTMKISIQGRPAKILRAYANVKNDGKKDVENGPFQCTALISQYLTVLGFKNAPGNIGNGRDVANGLGTGVNREFFDYSASGQHAPKVGSIVSMETNVEGVGHVAIVKGIQEQPDGSLKATLIEQNLSYVGAEGFAVKRVITFKKEEGIWKATHKINPAKKEPYKIVDWVTPKSLP